MNVEEASQKALEMAEDPSTCKCARIGFRNNKDGSRDVKLIGDIRCQICRGYGRVARCANCDGTGMVPGSKVCDKCHGNGKVPA